MAWVIFNFKNILEGKISCVTFEPTTRVQHFLGQFFATWQQKKLLMPFIKKKLWKIMLQRYQISNN
jgi:hypothetical protein